MKAFFQKYGLVFVVIAIFALFLAFAKGGFMTQLKQGILDSFNGLLG